jgi:hypothetical protein
MHKPHFGRDKQSVPSVRRMSRYLHIKDTLKTTYSSFSNRPFIITTRPTPLLRISWFVFRYSQLSITTFLLRISFILLLSEFAYIPGADPGFVVRGTWVGEGSGDSIWFPAGPGQSPGGQAHRKLWGFEELQTFIWTTILNQPHHFYQTKKTWLWENFVG